MAIITTRDSQPLRPSHDAAPPSGLGEGAFTPTFGGPGPGNGAEARTGQLSLLVEINAALAGALDGVSVAPAGNRLKVDAPVSQDQLLSLIRSGALSTSM